MNPELEVVLVSSRDRSSYGPLIEESGARGFVSKRTSPAQSRRATDVSRHGPPMPRPAAAARVAPGLLILAASATGGAVYLIAVSKIAPHPVRRAS